MGATCVRSACAEDIILAPLPPPSGGGRVGEVANGG